MTDKTDSKEREAFEAHYRQLGANEATLSRWVDDDVIPPAMVGKYTIRSVQDAWLAFQAGRASLAASAGSEPVESYAIRMLVAAGHITQAKADESLRLAAEFTHPSPPEGMVMVPVEPTEVMLDAVEEEVGGHCYSCSKWRASHDDCRRIWAAMIAAAPPTTSAGSGKGE